MNEALAFAASRFLDLANFRSLDLRRILEQSCFIPNPQWTIEQMPDQTGRTVFITGGNAGIGKECVRRLLSRNATVYIACRTRQNALDAIEEMYDTTGNCAYFIEMDLGDLGSVKRAVEEFQSKEKQLDVLINNAGIMFPPMHKLCGGYDAQMHVNVLGHFYLTKLLLPMLLSTAKMGRTPRIIHLSSIAQYAARADPLDFASFKSGAARDKYTTYDMYVQSKFAEILFSNELARRYGSDGLVSITVNPGNINTDLAQDVSNPLLRFALSLLQMYDVRHGALTSLWAATAEETKNYNGKFLVPWTRLGVPHAGTQNQQLAKDLWEWLEEQVPHS